MGPSAHIVWETFLAEDLGGLIRVDIVKEAGDVEEEQGPHIACLLGGLNLMDEGGDGIDGIVLWPIIRCPNA